MIHSVKFSTQLKSTETKNNKYQLIRKYYSMISVSLKSIVAC